MCVENVKSFVWANSVRSEGEQRKGARARARVCVMHSPRVRAAGEHTPLARSVRGFGLWRAFASGACVRVCVCVYCVWGGERRVCDVCKERVRRYRWHGLRVARFERLVGGGGRGGAPC